MKGWTTGWPDRVPAYIYCVPGPGGVIRSNIGINGMLMLARKVRAASSILRGGDDRLVRDAVERRRLP